jgi:aminopeptidase-like protein
VNVEPAEDLGSQMHQLLVELFPICRSLTGDGVRQTLRILKRYIALGMHEVPSGTRAFDWTVPKEWNIRDAFIADEAGVRVVDFKQCNLHVVGYSAAVDRWMTLDELQPHLYSHEDKPDAIPYVTSYYSERWGFCLAHRERLKLRPGRYHVVIDSTLADGHLTYAEHVVPGATSDEVLVSTYVCHPSMANNELSGPVVSTFIARWVASAPRRYTYRFVFLAETIGSIVYLSKNLESLKKNVIAVFNLSCIGDDRAYSYVASRYENTLADRVARAALASIDPGYNRYSFLDRGSDERQYGAPGVDLPVVTLCRSKFGEYPEYHTSLDDPTVVTASGLAGGYALVRDCLELLERNRRFKVTCLCEPQLGKRGLYPTVSKGRADEALRRMMNTIAYADGTNDLIAIAEKVGATPAALYDIVDRLVGAGLLVEAPTSGTPEVPASS